MNPVPARSTFVTVIAWIFIVLSGSWTMFAILQTIMAFTVFNSPMFQQTMTSLSGIPLTLSFVIRHAQLLAPISLLLAVLWLVSAINLLQRRNWARMVFVSLLVLGMIWQVVNVAFQVTALSTMRKQFASMAIPDAPNMQPFLLAATGFVVVLSISFFVLYGWIAKRLLTASVAAEFTPSGT